MQVVEQVDSSRGQSFFRSLDLIIDLFASGTCYVLSERRARGVGKRVVTGTRPKPDKSEHEIPRNILLAVLNRNQSNQFNRGTNQGRHDSPIFANCQFGIHLANKKKLQFNESILFLKIICMHSIVKQPNLGKNTLQNKIFYKIYYQYCGASFQKYRE